MTSCETYIPYIMTLLIVISYFSKARACIINCMLCHKDKTDALDLHDTALANDFKEANE